eukprot:g42686.t1
MWAFPHLARVEKSIRNVTGSHRNSGWCLVLTRDLQHKSISIVTHKEVYHNLETKTVNSFKSAGRFAAGSSAAVFSK